MSRQPSAATGEILEAALGYAGRGLAVLPLLGGAKRPNGPLVPSGLREASTAPAAIRSWWTRDPTSHVGIRTGGGLLVLDVDGEEGADSRAALERKHGPLPETPRAVTANGEHFYLQVSRAVPCSAGRLAPGLDIRADGGYVVAPPSSHPSGKRYEWDLTLDDVEIAAAPAWVLAGSADRTPGKTPASTWRQLAGGVREGQRNNAAARLCGHLLGHGIDPHVALDLLVSWDAQRNQPPLGRDEVTQVCESIAARQLRKGRSRVGA